jgi:rubrerythrin
MADQLKELLLQALETELGGVHIYTAAIRCAQNRDLRHEWEKYLDETRRHVEVVRGLLQDFNFDAEEQTPGRRIVKHIGESLVEAMQMAAADGTGDAAELVACECVMLAETKDHTNWELLRAYAEDVARGVQRKALDSACEEIEDQEDEHLYHSKGWGRELWLQALGMDAVLPPPEEQKHVKTAIGAARAEQSREEMLHHRR